MGYHNFVGRPIAGYVSAACILTRQAASALSSVQRALRERALGLKVYDCYRPTTAVADFAAWARNLTDLAMKQEFYVEVDKRLLFEQGYIAYNSSHCRGSTVDVTLVPLTNRPVQPEYVPGEQLRACTLPHGQRWADNSLDMGTGFDCFSNQSWTNNTERVPLAAQLNRRLLVSLMDTAGFKNLKEEWWHFTLRNEPFPNISFSFPVSAASRSRLPTLAWVVGLVLVVLGVTLQYDTLARP